MTRTKLDVAWSHYSAAGRSDDALPALLSSVRSYVIQRSKDEDLAQTVTTRVWLNLTKYDPARCPFGGWVARIASNCITDAKRKAARTSTLDEETIEFLSEQHEPAEPTSSRTRALIRDSDDPDLVELLLAGMTLDGCAKQLQITRSQVVWRIDKIKRKKLTDHIKKD